MFRSNIRLPRILNKYYFELSAFAGILVMTVVAYWPIFHSALICDDYYVLGLDRMHLFGDANLGHISALKWPFYALSPIYLRPTPMIIWFLLSSLFGLQPLPYHIADIGLHAANAFLLFLLLSRLSVPRTAAVLAGGLFAITPLAPEAVSWTAGMMDTLSLFFVLLMLTFYVHYLKGKSRFNYYVAVISSALALFSKEASIPLMALIPAADFLFAGNLGKTEPSSCNRTSFWRTRIGRFLPFALVLTGYLISRYAILGGVVGGGSLVFIKRIASTTRTISILLTPIDRNFASNIFAISFMKYYVALLSIAVIALLVFRLGKIPGMAKRVFSFFALMMVLEMIPGAGILLGGIGEDLEYSRLLYIPTSAMLAMIATGLFLFGWQNRIWKYTATAALVLLLPFYFWGLHHNNLFWEGISGKETAILNGAINLVPNPPSNSVIFIKEEGITASSRIYWCQPMLEPALKIAYGRYDLEVSQLVDGDTTDTSAGYLFVYNDQLGSVRLDHAPAGASSQSVHVVPNGAAGIPAAED